LIPNSTTCGYAVRPLGHVIEAVGLGIGKHKSKITKLLGSMVKNLRKGARNPRRIARFECLASMQVVVDRHWWAPWLSLVQLSLVQLSLVQLSLVQLSLVGLSGAAFGGVAALLYVFGLACTQGHDNVVLHARSLGMERRVW
jgi:hypothetical protein